MAGRVFDHLVVNDRVERAVDEILRILTAPDPPER
jgi:guanylate kinase